MLSGVDRNCAVCLVALVKPLKRENKKYENWIQIGIKTQNRWKHPLSRRLLLLLLYYILPSTSNSTSPFDERLTIISKEINYVNQCEYSSVIFISGWDWLEVIVPAAIPFAFHDILLPIEGFSAYMLIGFHSVLLLFSLIRRWNFVVYF